MRAVACVPTNTSTPIFGCFLAEHDTHLCVTVYQVTPGPSYTKARCLDQFEGKDGVGRNRPPTVSLRLLCC